LVIDKDLAIDGSALASHITISGDDLCRVFYINSGVTVTVVSLILAHGKSPYGSMGGGIFNAGALTVTNSTISENSAAVGGGIFNEGGALTMIDSILSYNDAYMDGGGVYSEGGTVTVSNSTLSYNNTSYSGGAMYNAGSTVMVSNSTFSDNSGDPNMSSYAGGIYNIGTLTISDSIFSNNSAHDCGGGIFNTTGTLTITNSIFSGNSVSGYHSAGGGIINDDTLIIANSTFSGNRAETGGAIYNNGTVGMLTVTDSSFSGNNAQDGGGIFNYGTLTVTNSTFSGNGTSDYQSVGGGISNYDTTIVMNSTFFQNSAYRGGGIHNWDTVTVTNSTFSGNEATSAGGGIANSGNRVGGTLTVRNSTFSANSAQHGGGIANIFISYQNSMLHYVNTIIANSTGGGDCYNVGKIGTNISNLVEDGSCSASFRGDPKLDTLADNGGPTQTMALLPRSPAIDAGNDATCEATDQRGISRRQGAHCDIGAYEYNTNSFNLKSIAAQDGWLLESGETSEKGGTLNKAAATIYIGDNAQKKQYRSILSFSTKDLPDKAMITKVTLKVKKQGIVGGGNPVNAFQGFIVDLKKGFFGSVTGLQKSDFQIGADESYRPFKPALQNGWYTINLTPARYWINKRATAGGVTQLRLRFELDDNNNAIANYLKLYSGEAPEASRPQLIIEYYVP
jgi:hypothetical protein